MKIAKKKFVNVNEDPVKIGTIISSFWNALISVILFIVYYIKLTNPKCASVYEPRKSERMLNLSKVMMLYSALGVLTSIIFVIAVTKGIAKLFKAWIKIHSAYSIAFTVPVVSTILYQIYLEMYYDAFIYVLILAPNMIWEIHFMSYIDFFKKMIKAKD